VKKTDLLEELRRLKPEELVARREAMEKEALHLRLQPPSQVKNFRAVREHRRNIARLNTILNEKARLAAADGEAGAKGAAAGGQPGREG
jgi:large subunit ribosomal protein L29